MVIKTQYNREPRCGLDDDSLMPATECCLMLSNHIDLLSGEMNDCAECEFGGEGLSQRALTTLMYRWGEYNRG